MTSVVQHKIDPKVARLQEALSQLAQFDGFKTTHRFAGGMYARSVWRPAGALIVGKLHKHEHFSILLSGEISVYADGVATRYTAPAVFVTPPGTKRATYAHTDAEFMTIHRLPEDTRDPDRVEALLIERDGSPALFDSNNELIDKALAEAVRPKIEVQSE